MIHIVRGDTSLAAALDSGRLDAHGETRFRRRLNAWLNLGPLDSAPSGLPSAGR